METAETNSSSGARNEFSKRTNKLAAHGKAFLEVAVQGLGFVIVVGRGTAFVFVAVFSLELVRFLVHDVI